MIRSMTGFGKGRETFKNGRVEVEIKSLNHKALSVGYNPGSDFFLAEQKLQKIIEGKVLRGKVFVKISKDMNADENESLVPEINEKLAKTYLRKIKSLGKALKIKGDIEIRDIVGYPGVVGTKRKKKNENIWPHVQKAATRAVDKLVEYRKTEGSKLAKDFIKRLRYIEQYLKEIKKYSKQSINEHRKKLIQSTKNISKEGRGDKTKLSEEVALFARNCDVTEEIIRLGGHVSAYKKTISGIQKEAGKKLDFVAQEMQREANTIGSKASDFRVSNCVIEIKSEIEKIREQIRNIE